MLIIKNLNELKKHLTKDKDLVVDEDVRIEFQVPKRELRDVKCRNLFLMKDDERFDFNGRDFTGGDFNGWNFNGRNFTGRDFNGWNFNGVDFNGGDFTGRNFNGGNFTGKDISYYAVFIANQSVKCTSIKGRRDNSIHKCLDGKIEIVSK